MGRGPFGSINLVDRSQNFRDRARPPQRRWQPVLRLGTFSSANDTSDEFSHISDV